MCRDHTSEKSTEPKKQARQNMKADNAIKSRETLYEKKVNLHFLIAAGRTIRHIAIKTVQMQQENQCKGNMQSHLLSAGVSTFIIFPIRDEFKAVAVVRQKQLFSGQKATSVHFKAQVHLFMLSNYCSLFSLHYFYT